MHQRQASICRASAYYNTILYIIKHNIIIIILVDIRTLGKYNLQ